MKIEEARDRIRELENYIEQINNYQADTFEKESIFLYVQLESVTKVAVELNKKGYKVGNRKVISKDVSDIIRTKATDDLHAMAKKLFNNNKGRAQKRGWV
ncbi:hypothetical protein [Lentibacillus sp. Marseille-P4043]|uniref:hypothetical protein n=1 Tax=Lentibacillus sp. Marseille-P4043 TaxID=2040293 RepID=UPI000D0BA9C0|nr:hypothetical protein [Lentibacillus sp. Marseille-P4043]